MKTIVVSMIVLLLCLTRTAFADLVVNEVLANEPGGETSLEWIELYNDSPTAANLVFYQLKIYSAADSAVLSPGGTIAPFQYSVFCRDTIRFEEHWGDSSGVWGDAAKENYPVSQLSFQLSNSGGRVAVFRLTALLSELVWTASGTDGCSWERLSPASLEIAQSVNPAGSTPGEINSITPLPIDLALEAASPSSDSGLTLIGFRIVNRGLTTVTDAILELYEFDPAAVDSLGSLVAGETVGAVDSGYAVLLVGQYQFPGYYQRLVGSLVVPGDYRPGNNRLVFTAPGTAYPPIILSELLANPDPNTGSEWVELKNISDSTFNLASWQLGDSSGLVTLLAAPTIDPSEYVVVVQDSTAFRAQYPLFTGKCYQAPSWREFNNGSDSVRLVDGFNIRSDHFYYASTYPDNHTWSRAESGEDEGRWGRSEDSGGTPGAANRVRFAPEGDQSLQITVEPRIISPDGDGRDDSTVIRIQVSSAPSYLLKLYDCHGRLVHTLEEGAADLRQEYVWRGETDSGERLPIGIYVLYFEAVGVESGRKTIVVAR
ncbi:MAG: lamin tail domain-containing protein [candidate division Zixibacteria bacterium]|nr:lamin tail domain-containing protein [candidate division Zixibacteria bacterium]